MTNEDDERKLREGQIAERKKFEALQRKKHKRRNAETTLRKRSTSALTLTRLQASDA